MSYHPPTVGRLIEALQRLPGIGPKTAQRLTFHLLKQPEGALASSGLWHAPVSLVRDGGPCPVPTRQARVGEATP